MGKIDTYPVPLPADFLELAESAVAGGEFGSVGQVVESALREWQIRREAEITRLRGLIDEGLASPVVPWNGVSSIIAEGRRRLSEREK